MVQISWFKYRVCIVLDVFYEFGFRQDCRIYRIAGFTGLQDLQDCRIYRIAGFTGSPAAGSPAAGFLFKDSFLIPITIHTMTASALAACSAKCMV